jgi:ketosteroid isomerase-like protein
MADLTNTESANAKWMRYFNQRSDSLALLYHEDAIAVYPKGYQFIGRDTILALLSQSSTQLCLVQPQQTFVANAERGLVYEIGSLVLSDEEQYKQLVIWQNTESGKQRVFEFAALVGPVNPGDRAYLDERRKWWMKFCNAHHIKALVWELYSEQTLYYNHKPLVIGRDSLLREYAYMEAEDYQLSLTPLVVELVNESVAIEIGQCAGSYNGKYILIWQRDEDGEWRIYVDSNI